MAYSNENQTENGEKSLWLPIASSARRLAHDASRPIANDRKREQVYFNTLAVLAVKDYLDLMEISTNLAGSDSWNPALRLCEDVADLAIAGLGRLECRPLRQNEAICRVPEEVMDDRIGYVPVRIDDSLRQGTLLGFVKTVATEELPLEQLQPLESMLVHLHELREESRLAVNLRRWFDGAIAAGWQTIEELLSPEQIELAFGFGRGVANSSPNFRGNSSANLSGNSSGNSSANFALPDLAIIRGRTIDLGMQLEQESLALVILAALADNSEIELLAQVHPQKGQRKGQPYLPAGVKLVLADESGAIILETESRELDNYIQLQFTGEPGDRFTITVALGEAAIVQKFTVETS
ncbi:MAG: DUF1822 family protein [Oscillatoria sp. SIO1A7]|nr:DUF1822 family protein [Oscillatoria sp. SIO1A7]